MVNKNRQVTLLLYYINIFTNNSGQNNKTNRPRDKSSSEKPKGFCRPNKDRRQLALGGKVERFFLFPFCYYCCFIFFWNGCAWGQESRDLCIRWMPSLQNGQKSQLVEQIRWKKPKSPEAATKWESNVGEGQGKPNKAFSLCLDGQKEGSAWTRDPGHADTLVPSERKHWRGWQCAWTSCTGGAFVGRPLL